MEFRAPPNTPSISHFNFSTPTWVSQDSTRASHVLKCLLVTRYSDRAKAGHVMVGCAIYACYFCKTSSVMHVEHVLRKKHINRQRNLISQCRNSVSRIPRELTNLLANCHLKHYAVAVRVYTVFSFFVFKFANEKRITNSFFVFRFQICERKTKKEFVIRFSFANLKTKKENTVYTRTCRSCRGEFGGFAFFTTAYYQTQREATSRPYAVPASVNTHHYCYLYCFITVCIRATKFTCRSITAEIFAAYGIAMKPHNLPTVVWSRGVGSVICHHAS